MTHTLTTSKGTFLFVGNAKITDELKHRLETTECKIIGKLSTLTEDQAREVVGPDFESPNINVCLMKLRSLMQAERLYTTETNPRGVFDSTERTRTFPDWLIIKINKTT